jgi:5-methyltetrahydrofolate--homocysteine methyltransferase
MEGVVMEKELMLGIGRQTIMDGDCKGASDNTERWLESGYEPLELLDLALTPGIHEVGALWEEGEYFLPELVSGAEAMKAAMGILERVLVPSDQQENSLHTAIIGTVQGDIHDIGKSLVGIMLRANGFNVHDLGADVSPSQFIKKHKESGARLICMSALLTTTMTGIADVIQAFYMDGLDDGVRFLAGGAPVSRDWTQTIGAHGYAGNAVEAVTVARNLMNEIRK